MYTWCKQFKSWKMCEITGTSYLRLDLSLRRHSWFRRCTQCHPERRHLMILWFLQTRSDDDEKQNDSWHRHPAHVQNTMQGNSSCQKHYISLYSESLTWYSLTDVMLTSKRLHRSSSSLTTTSWFSRPSTSIHTFSSAVSAADMGKKNGLWQQNIKQEVHHTLFGDEHVGTTNWERIQWTKHGWCRKLLLTWVQLVGPEFQAGALGRGQVRAQQVSPLHGCRPVAAWKEQEVTLRKRQGSLFYILLNIRDETRSYQWYLCLKMIKSVVLLVTVSAQIFSMRSETHDWHENMLLFLQYPQPKELKPWSSLSGSPLSVPRVWSWGGVEKCLSASWLVSSQSSWSFSRPFCPFWVLVQLHSPLSSVHFEPEVFETNTKRIKLCAVV